MQKGAGNLAAGRRRCLVISLRHKLGDSGRELLACKTRASGEEQVMGQWVIEPACFRLLGDFFGDRRPLGDVGELAPLFGELLGDAMPGSAPLHAAQAAQPKRRRDRPRASRALTPPGKPTWQRPSSRQENSRTVGLLRAARWRTLMQQRRFDMRGM